MKTYTIKYKHLSVDITMPYGSRKKKCLEIIKELASNPEITDIKLYTKDSRYNKGDYHE